MTKEQKDTENVQFEHSIDSNNENLNVENRNEEEENWCLENCVWRETLTARDDKTMDLSIINIKIIEELMDQNVSRQKTGIYLQLLRVVSGASNQGHNKISSSS